MIPGHSQTVGNQGGRNLKQLATLHPQEQRAANSSLLYTLRQFRILCLGNGVTKVDRFLDLTEHNQDNPLE